jgi:hypothetical protein
MPALPQAPLEIRFALRWEENEAGCHIWTGHVTRRGYGLLIDGQRSTKVVKRPAHRVSWELHNGPIPDGMSVLHKCDVPACVNPEHLFLGTQADNMRDMDAKGRRKNSPRPGELNGNALLTDTKVLKIKKLRARGWTYKQIGAEIGVHATTVFGIISGKSWKHLKEH